MLLICTTKGQQLVVGPLFRVDCWTVVPICTINTSRAWRERKRSTSKRNVVKRPSDSERPKRRSYPGEAMSPSLITFNISVETHHDKQIF